jgi:hypothetical protein
MIQFLDSAVSIHSLIWLFLAAFMLHDFEEIIRIEPWFRKHNEYLFKKVPAQFHKDLRSFSQITTPQFTVAVCLEFIIFIPATFLAAEMGNYLMFLGYNVVLLLHVFMHLGQALYAQKLIPGVLTAIGITLPYTVYLLYRLLSDNLITVSDILISLPLGLTLIPIILIGHWLGKKLVPTVTEASR